jgi:hypothetical protein
VMHNSCACMFGAEVHNKAVSSPFRKRMWTMCSVITPEIEAEVVVDDFWEYCGDDVRAEGIDSLLDAIYWWLVNGQALEDTHGVTELYLKAVALIIHQWHGGHESRAEFLPKFDSERGWRVLETDTYLKHLSPIAREYRHRTASA